MPPSADPGRDGGGPPVVEARDWRRREIGTALRNAAKLGSSLILTWGLSLAARLLIPRFLGPDEFGMLNFADAFTATAFVLLGLGMDHYVRKEIPLRPEHAAEFIGGIVTLRLAMVALLYLGMEIVLRLTHRSEAVRELVYLFGIAQFFSVGGATSAALLHAVGRVNEMSVLSVVTKLVWAIGIFVAIFFRLGSWAFPASLALSEGLKSLALFAIAKRHLGFRMRVDRRATWGVIVASMPFFVSGIAANVTNKIDVTILALTSSDREVGWYGAAAGMAGLTMFLTPLISWVLVPLFARAAAASEEELYVTIRRSSEFILALSIPVSLMMVVGADFATHLAFGAAFAPSAAALQVLAVAYLVMYVSIVAWCALTVLKHTWRVTAIMSAGLFVNPPLNLVLIKQGLRLRGDGGGGVACAVSTLITELVIVALLLRLLGRRGFDARLVGSVVKGLAIAALVVVVDRVALRSLGPWRFLVDGAGYAVLALVTGAVDLRGILGWTRQALAERKAAKR
jgi:O-antigen/teichoic acid export membrane protein